MLKSLEPDQSGHVVRPDLSLNLFQRLSADYKGKEFRIFRRRIKIIHVIKLFGLAGTLE